MLNSLLTRYDRAPDERVNWLRSTPFILVHLLPLAAIWTGVTSFDVALCAILFALKMFFVTAGYHRYFSHRAFKTSRAMQFLLAFGGGIAAQKGALWWAAHHRHHHRFSDQPEDIHSPMKGFWWSHIGWITCDRYNDTEYGAIRDFARYPELRFLDTYHYVPPVVLGAICFALGGWSALWIGFFGSTPGEAGWRIAIVDAADDLSVSAANALLKMLEEPPAGAVFLGVSDQIDAVLPTIRSRCVLVRVPAPPWAEALGWLRGRGRRHGFNGSSQG